MMKRKIIQICKKLEKQHGIKILFCVENGSRAWNMESANSDYDVRFVYIRKQEDYLSIIKTSDIISGAYDEKGKPCEKEGCIIDVEGFDIYKYLRLIMASNPTVLEWIYSSIIYYGEIPMDLKSIVEKHVNFNTLRYAYMSLAINNYEKYIKSKNEITFKRYLYTMRGIVNAKIVVAKKEIPPVDFEVGVLLLECSWRKIIPIEVTRRLRDIIDMKKKGLEKNKVKSEMLLDNYIKSVLDDERLNRGQHLFKDKEFNKKEIDIWLLEQFKKWRTIVVD